MTYFISGHRDITEEEFKKHYTPLINEILDAENHPHFIVGDCKGVDKMAMDYLADVVEDGMAYLTVYHMFDTPRVTPGDVPLKYIESVFDDCVDFKGGYQSDLERDSAMTNDSHFDIAWIRPGRDTSGTAQNIKRRYNL